jgi:predicted ribosome quality control (RQC) complex YloA/Tae2 family protein
MSSKGRPYRLFLVEGHEVLVGRGAVENDQLTFKVAAPRDLWLHVGGGTPGSHVVIRNPDNVTLPKAVIERAAELCAWFSKARNAGWLEVHVCRVADVSKPPGSPAGRVAIRRFERVKVKPIAPESAEEATAATGDDNVTTGKAATTGKPTN